jgi:hypothetical protein
MVEVYPYLGRVIDLMRVYRGYMSKSLYCINEFSYSGTCTMDLLKLW